MIINILKTLFAIVFLITLSYMANYIFKKTSWSNFYKMMGMFTVFGIIMIGQNFIARAYVYFEVNSASAPRLLGISRLLFVLFFTLVSVFSYYIYIVRFNKKRYQRQQNFVWVLALLSIVLAVLPQNEYARENPGVLLPQIRAIPSVILGIYVSMVVVIDGYYKRSANFQRFGLYLAAMQLVHLIYVFIFRAKAQDEFAVIVMSSILFMLMVYTFYRKLSKINELERF